jgi:hypothetical protein
LSLPKLTELEKIEHGEWLRSWVQIPPGPFLPVVQLRH